MHLSFAPALAVAAALAAASGAAASNEIASNDTPSTAVAPADDCAAAGRQLLSVDAQQAALRAGLERGLRESGSTARIVRIDGLRARCVPGLRAPTLEVGRIAGRWPRARAAVPLRVIDGGATLRVLTAHAVLEDPRTVPVHAADAAARTASAALGFDLREVDMICCAGQPGIATDALAGMRLRRAVRAGEPALLSDFEPVPAVVAHAPVRIEVARGAVRIVSDGIALADGGVGERVPVRAALSREPVRARIVAPGTVTIDPSP